MFSKKITIYLFFQLLLTQFLAAQSEFDAYHLIAHRGGVVDSSRTENSLQALKEAIRQGYYMVEIDMRLTKDGALITQHDDDFNRYFNRTEKVSDLTWDEIKTFRSNLGKSRVMKLEEVLKNCVGKIEVMIDNKVPGNDTVLFAKVVHLLEKYHLDENALMIGTEESTPYFTGKVKLSCTRRQLEENKKKPGYNRDDYYLFDGMNQLTQTDVNWAKKEGILTVAPINYPRNRDDDFEKEAAKFISNCKKWGVNYFQIDSDLAPMFSEK